MTRSFVEVPGGRLFVVDEGSGPPIVLLHHMIGMEQPDRLAAAIVEFLAPLERWS